MDEGGHNGLGPPALDDRLTSFQPWAGHRLMAAARVDAGAASVLGPLMSRYGAFCGGLTSQLMTSPGQVNQSQTAAAAFMHQYHQQLHLQFQQQRLQLGGRTERSCVSIHKTHSSK